MAFLGSNMATESGLRLLLVPFNSNVVIRTACCTVGVAIPVYSTFKAIERNDQNEQHKWLLYWAVYGTFSVGEIFADRFISWFPLYYHVKLAFLAWLQLPETNGAKIIYEKHVRRFLSQHYDKLERIVDGLYSEAGKFISAHRGELEFMNSIFKGIVKSVKQFIKRSSQPDATTQERRELVNRSSQRPSNEEVLDALAIAAREAAAQARRAIAVAGPSAQAETSDSNGDNRHSGDDDDDGEYVAVSAAS